MIGAGSGFEACDMVVEYYYEGACDYERSANTGCALYDCDVLILSS